MREAPIVILSVAKNPGAGSSLQLEPNIKNHTTTKQKICSSGYKSEPIEKLDAFVVMPNHLHGIVVIDNHAPSKNVAETLHATFLTQPL
ncbi:MAG: hypothetical protein V1936_01500 [Patescibacteria group bacterium]